MFADTIDDFVTVRYLSRGLDTEPLSVKIYDAARAAPTPAVNAAATIMLVATLLAPSGSRSCCTRGSPEGSGQERRWREGLRRLLGLSGQTRLERPRARPRRRDGVPASGSTRSASRGMCTLTGVPCANGHRSPSFGIHAWMRSPWREVDEHLQDRADVDDALHHARDAVLARRASRPRSTRSGRIVTFAGPRVSELALAGDQRELAELDPASAVHLPRRPCASIRFDTPRKSATYAVRGSS